MNQKTHRANSAILVSGFIFLTVSTASFAQTGPISIEDLTAEQFRELPARQVITAGEQQTTLGKLREEQRARKTAGEEWLTAAARQSESQLKSIAAQRERREARRANRANAEVDALMAHFALQIQENPEMAQRAADKAAEREQLHKLWLDSTKTTSPRDLRRIESEARRVLRRNN